MNEIKDNNGSLKVEINDNGIAQITFGHPTHNSLPANLLKKLADTIFQIGENNKVRVIVLKSIGSKTFCAGASFDELINIDSESAGKTFFSGFAFVINAIRLCGKIVVGQVQGKAVGGGVGLAAACDYCFATTQASIRLSELSIHIGPFVIAPAVQRKIGLVHFTTLALNPEQWQNAEWAHEKGLYQEVFSSMVEMENATKLFCEKLSSYAPNALAALKLILWEDTKHWDTLLFNRAGLSGKLVTSKQAKESLKILKTKN